MDPVTTALISGILGGAAGGVASEATGEVVRAYKNLRAMLMEKYGKDSILFRSLLSLEEKPESKNKQEGIAEDVVDCGADKNPEIQVAAKELLDLLKEAQPEAVYNATLNGGGAIAQGKGAVAAGAGGIAVGGNVGSEINMPGSEDD
ncbi:MAG: hypothetical protein Q3M24_10200 [Candidatus Electrothrix aestuarii]|uniref:Uncharacterized protein n=1 Tax=Candidatus Electrothrix aestuarii TaxID=3062594 RepID=A0AAU8M1E9_9BACT|nr:hypothetical protein [Candidatus Electrothrix aestuarii]